MNAETTSSETVHETPDVLETLAVELQTFRDKREDLVGSDFGRWALLKGEVVVCAMDTEMDAINTGYREFGNVPFLVAEILPFDRPAVFVSPALDL